MEKLKKFLKWPLFCISSIVFLAFTITLIVMCSKDYSKGIYSYELEMMGIEMSIDYDLQDRGKGVVDMIYTIGTTTETETGEVRYKVKDEKLFIMGEGETEYRLLGEIDAFEIEAKNDELGVEIVMQNKSAIAVRTLSIVMMSVFGGFALLSLAFILLCKYLPKKKTIVVSETQESQPSQPQTETI